MNGHLRWALLLVAACAALVPLWHDQRLSQAWLALAVLCGG